MVHEGTIHKTYDRLLLGKIPENFKNYELIQTLYMYILDSQSIPKCNSEFTTLKYNCKTCIYYGMFVTICHKSKIWVTIISESSKLHKENHQKLSLIQLVTEVFLIKFHLYIPSITLKLTPPHHLVLTICVSRRYNHCQDYSTALVSYIRIKY